MHSQMSTKQAFASFVKACFAFANQHFSYFQEQRTFFKDDFCLFVNTNLRIT